LYGNAYVIGGKFINVRPVFLSNGNTSSCGCLRKERLLAANAKHGLTGTPEYLCWKRLKARCLNANDPDFKHYGGRGIKICDEWLNDPKKFIDDIGKRPTPNHSIDRINVNGNYEKSNCRWATSKEQNQNRRNNRLFEINGVIKSIAEWADIYNIGVVQVHTRIHRGWDEMKALTTPLRGHSSCACCSLMWKPCPVNELEHTKKYEKQSSILATYQSLILLQNGMLKTQILQQWNCTANNHLMDCMVKLSA
jgi:hypothetical protein